MSKDTIQIILDHPPLTGLKEWSMEWDSALIFGALKYPDSPLS